MIQMLKGPDRVRRRPHIFFEGVDANGCANGLEKLVQNSVDEALLGHGKQILITAYRDGSYEVTDSGRGIPVETEEQVQEHFCQIYASDLTEKTEELRKALGSQSYVRFGLDLACVQFCSETMDVLVRRGGKRYLLHFAKGQYLPDRTRILPDRTPGSGTTIRYAPDKEIFTDTQISPGQLCTIANKAALCVPGLQVTVQCQQADGSFETVKRQYAQGLLSYMESLGHPVGQFHGRLELKDRSYWLSLDAFYTLSPRGAQTYTLFDHCPQKDGWMAAPWDGSGIVQHQALEKALRDCCGDNYELWQPDVKKALEYFPISLEVTSHCRDNTSATRVHWHGFEEQAVILLTQGLMRHFRENPQVLHRLLHLSKL